MTYSGTWIAANVKVHFPPKGDLRVYKNVVRHVSNGATEFLAIAHTTTTNHLGQFRIPGAHSIFKSNRLLRTTCKENLAFSLPEFGPKSTPRVMVKCDHFANAVVR